MGCLWKHTLFVMTPPALLCLPRRQAHPCRSAQCWQLSAQSSL